MSLTPLSQGNGAVVRGFAAHHSTTQYTPSLGRGEGAGGGAKSDGNNLYVKP